MENSDALTHTPPAAEATLAEGLKDSLPIVISYIPVAFAFGLNATKLGFTPRKPVLLLHYLRGC